MVSSEDLLAQCACVLTLHVVVYNVVNNAYISPYAKTSIYTAYYRQNLQAWTHSMINIIVYKCRNCYVQVTFDGSDHKTYSQVDVSEPAETAACRGSLVSVCA